MTLDMSRVDLQRLETVTLLDTNRRWEVTLTNGGTPFRLPNNWTASLVGVKPDEDENGLMLSCSVVDGRIIFDFAENEQLTTCAGAFPVVFDVWNEYGELVASPKIWLHVLPDVRPHEDLQSTGQYTTIGGLIADEKANREDIDKNTDDIEANAADIAEINALLYGYREGEPAEGKEPGAVLASVLALSGNAITRVTETGNGGNVDVDVKNNTIYSISGYDTVTILPPEGNYTAHLFVEFPSAAEAVGFVLPEGMEVSGNDPSTAAKGERWEVSLDSMGGAIFLRKAVLP
jgi:hypothetical protein